MGFDHCVCCPDVKDDELKPQVGEDRKEDNKEEEAEEEEVKKTLEDSLLNVKEEEEGEEEGKGEVAEEEEVKEEEVEQGQEASPATDTSCLPESGLSEEDVLPASPGSSSRPSSVDSPR